jgi:gliding motility-associated lipoprotein GldH
MQNSSQHRPRLKWLIGLLILIFSGCQTSTIYTVTYTLSDYLWHRKDNVKFNFYIQDTTQPYDIYLLIKDTPNYPYQNLYLTYYLEDIQSTVIATELKNYLLFESKTGHPLGKGWGKNKSHELILLKNYYFSNSGNYTLKLAQFMRIETLPGIQKVGIKICKASPTLMQ